MESVIQLQDYHLSVIHKLLTNDNPNLHTKPLPPDWESLVTLILNISYKYDFMDATREQAVILFKQYCQTKKDIQSPILASLVCLSLATRLEDKFVYGVQCILHELNYSVTVEEAVLQEQDICETLQWKLCVTTPIEFASCILYLANSFYDFSAILDQITNYVFLCLLDTDLVLYNATTIAITCTLSSLTQLQMHTFKEQLYQFIQQTFPQIKYADVQECMKSLAFKIQENCYPENLYGETSTGINSPNSITRYKMSGFDSNQDMIDRPPQQMQRSSHINSLLIKPQQPGGDSHQIFTCSATQSFVDQDTDESCFSERDMNEHFQCQKPRIFVSQIEKYFKNMRNQCFWSTSHPSIEEDQDDNDGRTVKFSIVSQDSELLKQTELYRQIRYQKSGSTLKNSLLSYFSSSIGIPDELKNETIKISVCPLALYASDHYFEKVHIVHL